ncbi:MAG: hypothetical protein HeimC3_17960 [Candidatus Heimdallarchaeota archaeon LC_3]|nr:MAG: hypothetical protein HeimC3_17960 [Candidatus Heimdallarchaeota archaeon LC_3]
MVFFFSDETIQKLSKIGLTIVGLGSIIVVLLLGTALLIYPGGFDFLDYPLSDLGHENANNNDPNPTSSLLFTLAMIFAGLMTIIYWFFSANVIYNKYTTKWKFFAILGGLAGVFSSLFLVLIGLFPSDKFVNEHDLVGLGFFVLATVALGLYSALFIIDFLEEYEGTKQMIYILLSFFVPILIGGIIMGIAEQIPTWLIFIFAGIIIIISIFLGWQFPDVSDYLTYILSIIVLVMISATILIVTTIGVIPILEATYVLVMMTFIMTTNYNVWELET